MLDRDKGLEGFAAAGPVLFTGVATTMETITLDRDGLGLGSFSPPERAHYEGYFLDHPEAVRSIHGTDGREYALLADNYNGRHHWFRLDGADRIKPAPRRPRWGRRPPRPWPPRRRRRRTSRAGTRSRW